MARPLYNHAQVPNRGRVRNLSRQATIDGRGGGESAGPCRGLSEAPSTTEVQT
jgi:hypothetical protein